MRSWILLMLVAAIIAVTAVNSTPISKRASPDSLAETKSKPKPHVHFEMNDEDVDITTKKYERVNEEAQALLRTTIDENKSIISVLTFVKEEEYDFEQWTRLNKQKDVPTEQGKNVAQLRLEAGHRVDFWGRKIKELRLEKSEPKFLSNEKINEISGDLEKLERESKALAKNNRDKNRKGEIKAFRKSIANKITEWQKLLDSRKRFLEGEADNHQVLNTTERDSWLKNYTYRENYFAKTEVDFKTELGSMLEYLDKLKGPGVAGADPQKGTSWFHRILGSS